MSIFTCKHTHNTFLKVFLIPPQLCFILAHPEILSCGKAKHQVSLEWSFLKDKEVLGVLPVVTGLTREPDHESQKAKLSSRSLWLQGTNCQAVPKRKEISPAKRSLSFYRVLLGGCVVVER